MEKIKATCGLPVYKVNGDGQSVSLGVFEQVKWERDVALEQLEELGYGLGEKIRTEEDCISRKAAIEIIENWLFYGDYNEGERNIMKVMQSILHELPSVKPKADVDTLINKIETEFSWSRYDDWANTTSLHDELVDFIRKWAESERDK